MNISGKEYEEVIITAEDGEVLAVVSDSEIIEKKDVKVILTPKHDCHNSIISAFRIRARRCFYIHFYPVTGSCG